VLSTMGRVAGQALRVGTSASTTSTGASVVGSP
jgi:hypothetical protein